MTQVAKDFGISASCRKRWRTIDEPKSGFALDGWPSRQRARCAAGFTKRIKLLEQENDVPPRVAAHLSQAFLPGE